MIDVLLATAVIALAHPQAPVDNAVCTYEDGNPDGSSCTWVDPDTGTRYEVDSSNYR
jgi:hypothetical protein